MRKQVREFEFRKVVPMTHEQYLSEPALVVDYTIGIQAERIKFEKEQAKR
jgi:hypothetical protein